MLALPKSATSQMSTFQPLFHNASAGKAQAFRSPNLHPGTPKYERGESMKSKRLPRHIIMIVTFTT